MARWIARTWAVGLMCSLAASVFAAEPRAIAPTATQATTAPATAPADPSTPKGALKTFALALDAGEKRGVRELLLATNRQEEHLADATAELAESAAALRRAAVGAFGEEKSRPLGVASSGTKEALARIDTATEKIDGDTVTLREAQSDGPPLKLVKKDGKWLMPVSELTKDVEPADVQRNIADMVWQSKQMRELSAEVTVGKYAGAAEARQALDRRIMERTLPPLKSATAPATQPAK